MASIGYSKELPVRHQVDVFVAGGGPAGMAAAATAARHGAKVFLAEGLAAFGGMGTSAGLPMFCHATDGVNVVSSGFGSEVYDGIWKEGGASPDMKRGELTTCLLYDPEALKRVYDGIAKDAGFEFSFNTSLIDIVSENGRTTHAICSAKSGVFAIEAKVFIDATGDGDLCAMAGAKFEKGSADGSMQPGTLCSLWTRIDWEKCHTVWAQSELPKSFGKGVFTIEDRHLPGIFRTDANSGWGNIGHTFGVDGTDERSVTKAMLWGRRLALEYGRFYKDYIPGCDNIKLLWTAQTLGVRETRRIMGDYVLNVEDFNKRAVFEDEIGRFSYPVDLHATKPGDGDFAKFEEEFKKMRYAPGENYGIPYRTLLPLGLDNVLVAGRCVSCDRQIQGSIRVMPGCFITGQAAGVASALAADKGVNPRKLDVKEIQGKLAKMGAYLPNFKG